MEPVTALIDSSQSRLRPVMMASLTTILGMIPLLPDAMFGSLAASIMGGLLFGTLITLLFIPILYALFFHIKRQTKKKKEILSAIGIIAGILFGTTLSLFAQERLSLKQCREMALKYNKEMAAADRQTEAARLMSLSYKANFFPNFTANGTGIYSTADGSLGIPGGNLPVFMPNPTTGELVSSGFAYFPGLNLDYKVGTVYSGGIQMEQLSLYGRQNSCGL